MSKVFSFLGLDNQAAMRRALTMVFGVIVLLAINPLLRRWGMPEVTDAAIESVAVLLTGYVIQSGYKSAVLSKTAADADTTMAKTP